MIYHASHYLGNIFYSSVQLGKFCVIIRGGRLGQTALYDAMRAGCVPVIVADTYILPFADVIDWKKAAILLYEEELLDMVSILKKHVSTQRLEEMQKQVKCMLMVC